MTNIRKAIIFIIFNVSVVCLVFLLCEGLASTAFVVREMTRRLPVAERRHTAYDQELGWINLPDVSIEDMYGPGVYLKTNSDLFRNNQNFSREVPPTKTRIICSGDSFTFGYGVDNDHTWCQQLLTINDNLESINMGQGGYGIDQAYLWYKRDGIKFDHNIHIFAFVNPDFARMRYDTFLGYGKPVITLQNGTLVTENIPVPTRSFYTPWLTRNQQVISDLSSIRLLQALFSSQNDDSVAEKGVDPLQAVVLNVFADLQQINQSKDSVLVFLYLPTKHDYMGHNSDSWRQLLHVAAYQNNWIFIDLVEEFRSLPPQEVEGLFIPVGAIEYRDAAGHYTEAGNVYMANLLYKKLLTIPPVADIITSQ